MNISLLESSDFRRPLHYLLLTLLALPFVVPLLWMISTAFKPTALIYNSPPQVLPNPISLENFSTALELIDFPRYLVNTLLVTLLAVAGTVFSSSIVGYAFAVIPARGKRLLFALLLATIMVPPTATLIPLFIGFSQMGWVDTYLPLVIPHFFANAFYVFLFRQFYLSLSPDLFESAELDGSNPFSSYLHIALPLSRPPIAAVAVFAFIANWNDFLTPLVYINTNSKYTVSLGLSLFQGTYYTQLHYLMPLSLVAVLPIILIFILAQRYLIQGIFTTGLKG